MAGPTHSPTGLMIDAAASRRITKVDEHSNPVIRSFIASFDVAHKPEQSQRIAPAFVFEIQYHDNMIPNAEIDRLQPAVRTMFTRWTDFLNSRVEFNMPQSEIHAAAHCERVLLYALILGHEIFGDDPMALEALAHAAVFHDSRRQDDYLDTGHGARAAVYYQQFCNSHPDINFHPEAMLMMKYHDIDDKRSKVRIRREYAGSLPKMFKLYDIFKDADALDRWRLGASGFDTRFLRTEQARKMTDFSLRIVEQTMPADLLASISREVEKTMNSQQAED